MRLSREALSCSSRVSPSRPSRSPAGKEDRTFGRSEDGAAEVYVSIGQFDVDTRGNAVLVAWWRILAPGGEKTLKAGECRVARSGLPPDVSPSGAVATLNDLMADLSCQLAQALKETTTTR